MKKEKDKNEAGKKGKEIEWERPIFGLPAPLLVGRMTAASQPELETEVRITPNGARKREVPRLSDWARNDEHPNSLAAFTSGQNLAASLDKEIRELPSGRPSNLPI